MAEVEFAGVKFTGGKMFAVITALTTLVGGLYGAFEVYKDYMDMKAQIRSYVAPDLSGIEKKLAVSVNKVNDAVDYSRAIKDDLRDDMTRLEKYVDAVEKKNNELEDKVKSMIDRASERFDTKRESLQTDTEIKIRSVEDRLNKKIQVALDNPLAN